MNVDEDTEFCDCGDCVARSNFEAEDPIRTITVKLHAPSEDQVVRCFMHDAEAIARALQRAFKAGQRDRSAELSRLLADRDR